MLDPVTLLRFAAALATVLALIAGLGWLLRRTALGRVVGAGRGRLEVADTLALDARRRLLLVKRDGVEHLLLLSPTSELIVESGIKPLAKRATPLSAAHVAEDAGA